MKSFIVLPGKAVQDLREELELIEGEEAGQTLERFGYRAGVNLVKDLGIECQDLQKLGEYLPQLWYEAGLSAMEIEMIGDEEIVAVLESSVESEMGNRYDFSLGYLAGIITSLTGRRFRVVDAEEEKAGKCRVRLRPADDTVELIRESAGRPALDLERGYSYLIKTDDPDPAFRIFEDYLLHGIPGMCISREYPEKLKKRYRLDGAKMLWLSYDRDIPYAREPTNIPLIFSEVKSFLDSDREVVVLVSGLEYMISQSTYIKVLKFVQLLNENVAVKNSLLLLPLSPGTLEEREVRLLERELRVLDIEDLEHRNA